MVELYTMEIMVSTNDMNALFHLSQSTGKDLWVSSCDFKHIHSYH